MSVVSDRRFFKVNASSLLLTATQEEETVKRNSLESTEETNNTLFIKDVSDRGDK